MLMADELRIGAIHMEMGEYGLGQEWYAKAVKRGATVDSVDQDLHSVFFRSAPDRQAEMSAFLLGENPVRYAWAVPRKTPPKSPPQSEAKC